MDKGSAMISTSRARDGGGSSSRTLRTTWVRGRSTVVAGHMARLGPVSNSGKGFTTQANYSCTTVSIEVNPV